MKCAEKQKSTLQYIPLSNLQTDRETATSNTSSPSTKLSIKQRKVKCPERSKTILSADTKKHLIDFRNFPVFDKAIE